MKLAPLAAILSTFQLFNLSTLQPAHADVWLPVYSPDNGLDMPLHVEAVRTLPGAFGSISNRRETVVGRWTFPASYLGHRATCHLVGASTNDVYFNAWAGDSDSYDPQSCPLYGTSRMMDYPMVELTDFSPITPRFNLWESGAMLMGNTNIGTGASWEYGADVGIPGGPVRVRVVRWKIDGMPRYSLAIPPQVVYDKILNSSVAKAMTETDFVDDNSFDIDWDSFYSEVVESRAVVYGHYNLVKMDYLVVLGDGDVSFLSSDDTNKLLTVSKQIITRRYGVDQVRAVALPTDSVSPSAEAVGIVNTPSPTFTWNIDCPDREGYTAFRLQVTEAGGDVLYDSGIRRAPARDLDGVYRWTAPLDVIPRGVTNFWRVAMYSSKFKEDMFSTNSASFFIPY